jgi:hypothetical protein
MCYAVIEFLQDFESSIDMDVSCEFLLTAHAVHAALQVIGAKVAGCPEP